MRSDDQGLVSKPLQESNGKLLYGKWMGEKHERKGETGLARVVAQKWDDDVVLDQVNSNRNGKDRIRDVLETYSRIGQTGIQGEGEVKKTMTCKFLV